MDVSVASDGLALAAHVAQPGRAAAGLRPALVLCHGFPAGPRQAVPADVEAWAMAFKEVQPLSAAAKVPPRPLLLMHGAEDRTVPVSDARALADAAGGQADLRVIPGAGHRLRHDPRAVAALMGW